MTIARAGIGFDIDHTIAIDNKLERVAFLRLLEILIEDGGRALGSLDNEIAKIDELLVQQRSGAFSIDDAVARFTEERGVAPVPRYAENFRTMAVEMVADFVIPLPGARQTFRGLRERGFVLAVLSNGWNPLQIQKARRAGFDGPVLASADLGVQKPHRAAFDAMLAVLGTDIADTWYVGDDPLCDVGGARAAGLRAIWFDPENRRFPSDASPPTSTARALEDILACVTPHSV